MPSPTISSRRRQSSSERRATVLAAARHEFAERGYHAASTAAIAKRAGISQPYIYALFPSKKELFLAVHDEVVDDIRRAFLGAAAGAADPDAALQCMGKAYSELIADRVTLLCQMQAHAAAGDPEIGPRVAACFEGLMEDVRRASGATDEAVADFFACGMLINVTTALGLPQLAEPALRWDK